MVTADVALTYSYIMCFSYYYFCSITTRGHSEDGNRNATDLNIGYWRESSLQHDSQTAQMIPRGGATSPYFRLNLRRVCTAASAYTGPNSERPLFCSQ